MKRIQRQRTKGWRMPKGAVYVGRPTRWGNPWRIGDWYLGRPLTPREAVQVFGVYAAEQSADDPAWLEPLRHKDLVCWCPVSRPCHADVLLEMAA